MSELRVDQVKDAAGTGAPDFANGLTVNSGASISELTHGTYTPTQTNDGALVNAGTPQTAFYTRVGDIVTVHGTISGLNTSGGGSGDCRLSLPISSTFSSAINLTGQGNTTVINTNLWENLYIEADITNNEARFKFRTSGTGSRTVYYSFSYRVL